MANAALQLQTALLFANLMKNPAYHLGKTIMGVNYRQYVLYKNEITMETLVMYIVLVYAMKVKSCARVKEMKMVAKNQTFVSRYPRNYGEKMQEIGAQDSALPSAKIGNIYALQYKILAMAAQQNLYVNQLLKM